MINSLFLFSLPFFFTLSISTYIPFTILHHLTFSKHIYSFFFSPFSPIYYLSVLSKLLTFFYTLFHYISVLIFLSILILPIIQTIIHSFFIINHVIFCFFLNILISKFYTVTPLLNFTSPFCLSLFSLILSSLTTAASSSSLFLIFLKLYFYIASIIELLTSNLPLNHF